MGRTGHIYENEVRDAAAKGSHEARAILEEWEAGTKGKSHKEKRHPYYKALLEGASKGSDLCVKKIRDWAKEDDDIAKDAKKSGVKL